MLIYNHKKEFVGIDKRDLEALGFSDLGKLLAECNDFAELFVKTPGYIHDFKHVHWIDFITCAQSNEDTKVIIHAGGKSYKATLHIDTIYLIVDPTQKAYSVTLANLRELSKEESQNISDDILDKPLLKTSYVAPQEEEYAAVETPPLKEASTPEIKPEPEAIVPIEDSYEEAPEIMIDEFDEMQSDDKLELDLDEEIPQEEIPATQAQDEDDFKLDLDDIHADVSETLEPVVEEKQPANKAAPSQAVIAEDDDFDYNYVYDPHVASEELGLPLDLIEEFIQDFINQAYEFKDELYESLDQGKIDNVRILSHKLKGVAANLRIEDAFDVLVTVNTSDDVNKILLNLNRFYKIIAKLAGEEIPQTQSVSSTAPSPEESVEDDFTEDDFALDIKEEIAEEEVKPQEQEVHEEDGVIEDDFALDFKEDEDEDLYLDYNTQELEDEPLSVDDSQVPEKIEIAELADDDFVHTSEEEESSNELEDISFMEDVEPLEMNEDALLEESQEQNEFQSSYDKSVVANEIGLTKESFNELFNDYLQDSKELVNDLENALVAEDASQYKKAAMKLKGMSDNMRIHDFTQELETLIATDDMQSAKNSIEAIKTKLNSLSKIED
ncbi:MAG: Hpt domain-containing protein [Sulfurimonas sp.]|jgi:HPt (histidine-containing phosphotransfer) domain-containing protein|nr:Hpt domain-containing protein [Sulfurimonas sp.]